MKDEIKEILDRLERIDHKEYIAFEFADGATFDEMARCFEERKKMADCITNLQKQIEEYQKALDETMSEKIDLQEEKQRLLKKLDFMIDKNDEKQKVIDEAIEKLKYYSGGEADYYVPIDEVLSILKGE